MIVGLLQREHAASDPWASSLRNELNGAREISGFHTVGALSEMLGTVRRSFRVLQDRSKMMDFEWRQPSSDSGPRSLPYPDAFLPPSGSPG